MKKNVLIKVMATVLAIGSMAPVVAMATDAQPVNDIILISENPTVNESKFVIATGKISSLDENGAKVPIAIG